MLRRTICRATAPRYGSFTSRDTSRTKRYFSDSPQHIATSKVIRPVPTLPDNTLESFRQHAFEPALPALLPRGSQSHIPAVTKWFLPADHSSPASNVQLNHRYLSNYSGALVPLEITNNGDFVRIENTMRFFLEFVYASDSTFKLTPESDPFHLDNSAHEIPSATIYIAQASLPDLPKAMRDDLPTPDLVLRAGKGDVYDSSIWLGQAPTYTPLHKDPNPNLFVQLAGRKCVRLYAPKAGNRIFSEVQEMIGGSGTASMRGEEMMQGEERRILEKVVWGDGEGEGGPEGWEAELESGDALFIPKGWWHSVKGVGEGINGSVNWWFR
jgi:hypothetical protein